jgi:hypothetical protein
MRARAKELAEEKAYREKQAAIVGEYKGDAINLDENGDPDDLPF